MSDMIIDPMFPAKEPCPHHQQNYAWGPHFGASAQTTSTPWHVCCITASELLHMHIITLPQTHLNSTLRYQAMEDILDDLLPYSLPRNIALQVQNQSAQANTTLSAIIYSEVLNATMFNATS